MYLHPTVGNNIAAGWQPRRVGVAFVRGGGGCCDITVSRQGTADTAAEDMIAVEKESPIPACGRDGAVCMTNSIIVVVFFVYGKVRFPSQEFPLHRPSPCIAGSCAVSTGV